MEPRAPAARISPDEDDERVLVEAAQRDPGRFSELYQRHFDRVYAFIARRAGGRAEAEDLTAEVFHHALASLGRFEWRGAPFIAWLLQIARNALADRWQRTGREQGIPQPEQGEDETRAGVERRAVLAGLLSSLPKDQERVLLERFVEQKSIREIALGLQRTEGAVKQLQFRALESLRAQMRDGHE